MIGHRAPPVSEGQTPVEPGKLGDSALIATAKSFLPFPVPGM